MGVEHQDTQTNFRGHQLPYGLRQHRVIPPLEDLIVCLVFGVASIVWFEGLKLTGFARGLEPGLVG